MTDYEFKKGLLKALKDISSEMRKTNAILTNIQQANDELAKEVQESGSYNMRHFKCLHCGHEESSATYLTDSYYGAYVICPECGYLSYDSQK